MTPERDARDRDEPERDEPERDEPERDEPDRDEPVKPKAKENATPWKLAGVALLALLPLHVWLRPEGAWALLSTCDVACIATALGLILSKHRLVGTAFLFQLMVGLPALVLGILTTYQWNWSGIAIHLSPLALGAVQVRRRGLPKKAASDAWFAYALTLFIAAKVSPPELNINFGSVVWKPLAETFSLRVFQLLLIATVGALLYLGQLVARFNSRRARAR
jgi:hypothetical protein